MTLDARVDPLSGATTVVTGSRQSRPNLPSTGCPFCVGGLEAPEPYDVRWFTNRWPAIPDDRAEVILYTPDHDATFWSLGAEGAAAVVGLWSERTVELGGRDDVAYVLPFENRGPEVGATIAHPHGQLYAFPEVPDAARRELDGDDDGCRLCTALGDPGERLVTAVDGWVAEVPHAALWPFELLLRPLAHVPDLPAGGPVEHRRLGALLVDVLERLDRLFDAPMPSMLWVHQRPTDGGEWPGAHLHVHVAPLLRAAGTPRFVAAGELGSGVYFNPVAPEDAAAQLREAVAR
jgi:UDPglucose--hexose-1-phosphate uridylyltransferase